MSEVDLKDSQVTLLVEVDGKVHLVGMDKEEYKVISELVKRSIKLVVPTGKSQKDLRLFFGLDNAAI